MSYMDIEAKREFLPYLKIKVKLSRLKQIKEMDFAFKLRKRLCHVGFPGGSDGKEFAPNAKTWV